MKAASLFAPGGSSPVVIYFNDSMIVVFPISKYLCININTRYDVLTIYLISL